MKVVTSVLCGILMLGLATVAGADDTLVVGTSADYPPYEYTDDKGEFVGFDMDLIRAVGEKMGKKVKIVDMGFDTLIAGLQNKKIDAVIAAMQASEERKQKVDFSITYHEIKDAILAKADSDIELTSINEIVDYKVASQTGTIQEKWIQDNLIKTGKLPEENYFSYERVDNAAMDIKAGRVDVLHIIADPAISLAEKNDLKIALITTEAVSAGQSIAVTKGNTELLDAINKAIEELKADGTLQALMDKYKLL
ncbi:MULTISPECIES: transporter substrate-binding domain-containing protein [Desulfotignum]|jgi:polar amino acid transport system substrate-binding protein|uniref:ABC transporter arginine/polar amino acids-binding protein ArtI n=2 Tax=Desulfotignum TaxID=115780 RepID=S0G2F6_9BACT|nr:MULTISPECIES: transporter substrate-binding domain-containing protein [Desulfotignum]EMS81528.1 ABC transporter arginine/polar amino acids-binding protein ArtI [Desulfotignum phosphitoxidans DSM 13687]MBG0778682.1 transporter substrate-binding domain-containing protein [Desulfotignum balticum]